MSALASSSADYASPTVAEFASAVRAFLDSLDSSRTFGDEALDTAREAIAVLQGYATALLNAWEGVPPVSTDEIQLRAAVTLLADALPDPTSLSDRMPEWLAIRDRLSPLYERLAIALAEDGVDARPLRPSNYARSVFHASSGLFAIAIFEAGFDMRLLTGLAVAVVIWAWTMEVGRVFSPWLNDWLMWAFSLVSHPHEAVRINSATWYSSAAAIITILSPNYVGVLALLVLAVGDPMAGLVGRRFGRTKLVGPKSAEGTAAFVVTSVLAGLLYLGIWHPELGGLDMVLFASVAALSGGIAELGTSRLDDNFTIPLAAMLGGLAVGALVL